VVQIFKMKKGRTKSRGRGQGQKDENEEDITEDIEDEDEDEDEDDEMSEEEERDDQEKEASSISASSLRQQIITNFGSGSLYEILQISSTASPEEIRRAYRQSALKFHPDKGGDPEKFKALSAIHLILSNEETRRVYDETGEIDSEASGGPSSGTFDDWYEYYRQLFPQISLNDIANYEVKYKGSAEEQQDVWDAYQKYSGDLKRIMECVMFAEMPEDEQRIMGIIDEGLEKNILETTPQYQQAKITMTHRKPKRVSQSKKGAATLSQTEGSGGSGAGGRAEGGKKKKGKADGDDMDSLRNAILKRHSNPFDNILSKYSKADMNLEDYEVNDEEFIKTQQDLMKKKSRTRGGAGRGEGTEEGEITSKAKRGEVNGKKRKK
jgi:DnaJ homolog subfamily C member 9